MPIPDFQQLMLPMLRLAADGLDHSLSETIDYLAQQFGLDEDERRVLLPSGRQATFDNRIGWARTHLGKAGLLESPRRGLFHITDRGRALLQDNPSAITMPVLMRYPEYTDFRARTRGTNESDQTESVPTTERTPQETLELSYQSLRATLAQELLDRVKQSSPRFFEILVVDLLVAMGYGGSRRDAGQAIGRSGDSGIDGIIKEDKLGLDVIYIQAKRWEETVSRPTVQAFAGSLEGHRARKGVLITTSQFSSQAKDYVERIEKKIILIDGEQLTQLMIDHNVGVASVTSYVVKRIDLDYFGDEE